MFIGDLLFRAGLDLAKLQQDVARVGPIFAQIPNQLRARIEVTDAFSKMEQQGKQAFKNIATSAEAETRRIRAAVQSATNQIPAVAGPAILGPAIPLGPPPDQIRSWQDYAAAVRAEKQAAEEAAAANNALASSTAAAADASRVAAQNEEVRAQLARDTPRLDAQIAARQVQQAALNATAAARAAVTAEEAEFKASQARIKDAQARGLLTPADAARAGREAAIAYNQGIISAIDRAGAAGALKGATGQATFVQMAGSLKNVDAEARRAGIGIQSLRGPLTTLSAQALSVTPALATAASVLGAFAIGSGTMAAVLAGLAAVALAWRVIAKDAREAREAQREAIESGTQLRTAQQDAESGPAGTLVRQMDEVQDRIKDIDSGWRGVGRTMLEALNPTIFGALSSAAIDAIEDAKSTAIGALLSIEREKERIESTARNRNEDAVRSAEQSATLAGLEGTALARARVEFEAKNRTLAAQRDLTGEVRDQTILAIEAERAWGQAAIAAAEKLEARRTNEGSADIIREAEQSLQLAREQGTAQARLRIEYDAVNKAIAARRDIENGAAQAARLAAIETERRIAQQGLIESTIRNGLASHSFAPIPLAVTIGGINISNPEQAQRDYERAVQEALSTGKVLVFGDLDLRLRTTPRGTAQAAERAGLSAKQQDLEAFNQTVEAIHNATRGFRDLADALGDISPVVSALLRSIDQVAEGASTLKASENLTGNAQTLAQISGILTISAAGIELAKTLLGRSELEKERDSILQQNNARLDALRRELVAAHFDASEGGRLRDALTDRNTRPIDTFFSFGGARERAASRDRIQQIVEAAGISMEAFNRIVEDSGIVLYQNGILIDGALKQLAERIGLTIEAITGFRDTLADRQQERGLRDRIQGVERDPSQQADVLFGDLKTLAPQLFERFFAGVDIGNVEDIRARLLAAFNAFADNAAGFAELMGKNLSRDEFLQWVGQAADAAKGMTEAVQNMTTSLQNVPEVFNFTLASLRAAGPREFIPSGIRTGEDASGVSVSVDVGGITVDAREDASGLSDSLTAVLADAVASAVREAGVSLTAAKVDEIRRKLKASLVSAAAGQGERERAFARDFPGN